ncbi:molybdenum cofactor biosynthesis protein MoaE [Bdellovibrionota bacterium FG-1]
MQSLSEVTENPIDPSRFWTEVVAPSHGAQVCFFGVVRDFNDGKKVVAVSYDAFVPMAEKVLAELIVECQKRWGDDLRVIVRHRIGRLGVGEVSVGIAVSAAHRDEAYQASRYLIEQIKVRVPIWKKEHYENGETEWLKGHALCAKHQK